MKYRIDYADRRYCSHAADRRDLIKRLAVLRAGEVADIRKVYKSGVTDSVMEKYENYLTPDGRCRDV